MRLDRPQLDHLCAIAREAGREIMAIYGRAFTVWTKDDASALTEADLRADQVIRQGLEAAFPATYLWSEESRSSGSTETGVFFLVDPLDGTKEFLQRNGEFTVNIALIAAGRPVAAVVLAPASGALYFAAEGLGAWKQGPQGPVPLRVQAPDPGQPLPVLGSRSHGTDAVGVWLNQLGRPWVLHPVGSSLKFCQMAEGLGALYPRFGPTCQWDTAAGQCILEQAGGAVVDRHGQALAYGLQRPILNPYFVALADPASAGLLPPWPAEAPAP
ncbi:MAG: 3'(2'),5'-bisphosphate nucleotidase CysQ [Burkholderiaceae bacterium]|nr:3'(2'),5'-bisphosphate nucleotidase CysQ [Burkholderiaceae bacterium]